MRPAGQAALDEAVDALFQEHGLEEQYTDGDGISHPVTVLYTERNVISTPADMGIENTRPYAEIKLGNGLNPQRGDWLTIAGVPREIVAVERTVSRSLAKLYLSTLE